MRRHLPLALLILLGVFAAYSSVLFAHYGFADDYPHLREASTPGGPKWIVSGCASKGRILYGLLMEYSFRAAGDVQRLRHIRLGAVVAIAAVALLIYRHLLRHHPSRLLAASVALFIVTLPPFQTYAFWATCSPFPLAVLLTYPAYRLLSGPFRWHRLAGAVALMWAALNIYQPAAMFLWFWLVSELLLSPLAWTHFRRRVAFFTAAFVACVGFYFVVYKLTGLTNPRAAVAAEPLGKIDWFFTDLLLSTFRFHLVTAPAIVGLILLLAILLILALNLRSTLLKLLLVAIALPLAHLPNLGAAESWTNYRTQPGVMAVAAMLLCYALITLADRFAPAGRRTAVVAVLLGPLGVLLAAYTVTHLVTTPQSVEYRVARANLKPYDPQRHSGILFIQPDWNSLLVGRHYPGRRLDEFGTPSSLMPKRFGIPLSLAYLALRDARPDLTLPIDPKPLITVHAPHDDEPLPADPKLLSVDMRQLKDFRTDR